MIKTCCCFNSGNKVRKCTKLASKLDVVLGGSWGEHFGTLFQVLWLWEVPINKKSVVRTLNRVFCNSTFSACPVDESDTITKLQFSSAFAIWRYIYPARAWLLSSPSLPSWQVNMAVVELNEAFIYANLITPIPGNDGEFSKWLLSSLDQNYFQELVFKAVKNHKSSGYVDHQQVRSIDRNLFSFKLKLLIFRRWWQLWMKTTGIKQRYRMNLFFVVFRSFILLLNSISKLIHNRCSCMLIIKTTAAYVHADEQLRLCFYVLFRYFEVLDIHLGKLY